MKTIVVDFNWTRGHGNHNQVVTVEKPGVVEMDERVLLSDEEELEVEGTVEAILDNCADREYRMIIFRIDGDTWKNIEP